MKKNNSYSAQFKIIHQSSPPVQNPVQYYPNEIEKKIKIRTLSTKIIKTKPRIYK